jgi:hypothetical protein
MNRRKIFTVCLIVLFFSILLEIWSLNRLSNFGEQISNLERTKRQLTLDNQLLQDRISQKASLQKIEKVAKLAGFTDPKSIQYIGK